jgi:hypothetical protein
MKRSYALADIGPYSDARIPGGCVEDQLYGWVKRLYNTQNILFLECV